MKNTKNFMSSENKTMKFESNEFHRLGLLHKTDKVLHHKYSKIYDFFLKSMYKNEGSILEIGINQGKSLKLWLDLFPNAFVYGIDIGVNSEGENFRIFKKDQSKVKDLLDVQKELRDKKLFFINDDGSHLPEHQLLTFNTLFPLLEEGGVYIIEDIETSYWTKHDVYGYPTRYGYKHKKSVIELFKDVVDGINSEFSGEREYAVKHMNSIGSITFSQNCIIIVKEAQEQRIYRYRHKL
tara:strand:- start:980 stop:1693 length:714 start_codon:yes stop_codon:yes gene_type:complete